MKKILGVLAFVALALGSAQAQMEVERSLEFKREAVKSHDKAFISMGDKIRDPFILVGPDGAYYLTGTTAGSFWGEKVGVKIYRSEDLCEWDDLGYVWELKDTNSWYYNRPPKEGAKPSKNPYAVWAPEVHYFNDTWWLTVSRNGGGNGLMKSASGKVEGPYEEVLHYNTGIDSNLFGDGDKVYYSFGYEQIAPLTPEMDAVAEEGFTALQLPGKHPMGYEGILMLKFEDKYLWVASGRYGYEPTNTYDLYYSVSNNLLEGYSARRMAIKNAGHGNIFCDNNGQWWATAFDNEFAKEWNCWLVPINLRLEGDDVVIDVLDERFDPKAEDDAVVELLDLTGPPAEWKGKTWWWRKDGK